MVVLYNIYVVATKENIQWLSVFLPTALGFTLAVGVRGLEGTKPERLRIMLGIAVGLALANGLWCARFEKWDTAMFISQISIWTAVGSAMLFVPVSSKGADELPSWRFAMQQGISGVLCFFLGVLMSLVVVATAETISALFDVLISWRAVTCLMIVAGGTAAFVFMCGIQSRHRKSLGHRNEEQFGFITKAAMYFLCPAVGLYMLILYAYGAKILFTWNLPAGMVSAPVTGLFAAVMLVEFLLYPIMINGNHTFVTKAMRLLPCLMLPLLVLMSVGLGRRIADYGISPWRLYGVVFNLWAYMVCIGLCIKGNRRFVWIPTLFAALFLAVSIIPKFNIYEICEHHSVIAMKELFRSRAGSDVQFPMSYKSYECHYDTMSKDDREEVTDAMRDLYYNYGEEALEDIIGQPFQVYDVIWCH